MTYDTHVYTYPYTHVFTCGYAHVYTHAYTHVCALLYTHVYAPSTHMSTCDCTAHAKVPNPAKTAAPPPFCR